MRIVYLLGTSGGAWGGLERHVIDLAGAVARHNEVHLIADGAFEKRVPKEIRFHACDMTSSRYSLGMWFRLRGMLRHINPNVVHAQGGKAAALLSRHGRQLATMGAVTVGSVHGTKSGHRMYAKLNGVIAVSAEIASAIQHAHCRVVVNGIEPSKPDPAQVNLCWEQRRTWNGPLVLAIGRLAPVKGFDLLLQAWSSVPEAHLLILGDGPERVALERQSQAAGLQSRVTFLGHTTAVSAWLAVADAMVISSRREGFPYVLIEALQAACPVLATKVSGVSAILPDDMMAPVGDVEALAGLLNTKLRSIDALREAQEPLFRMSQTELTLDAMKSKTIDFYQFLHEQYA